MHELDAVIAVIPDQTVDKDALGPVLRLVILAAATSGLRQSELLGLHWKHVDMRAQRIRIRNAWVRHEHSGCPLSETAAAIRQVQDGHARGKIVIAVSHGSSLAAPPARRRAATLKPPP